MPANVSVGTVSNRNGPFEVPPELGGGAESASGVEARVTVQDVERDPWYEICNPARFECVLTGQCPLDEVEVVV